MEKTLMEIIDKLIKIEDDEQFCIAEYDAVQDYCYKKDFQLSKEERQIIRDIGLEESFFSWMEDRGKRIGYQGCIRIQRVPAVRWQSTDLSGKRDRGKIQKELPQISMGRSETFPRRSHI